MSSNQQGGILLGLLTIVFIVSLGIFGVVAYTLWQDVGSVSGLKTLVTTGTFSTQAEPTTSPAADPLAAELMLDAALEGERDELNQQLRSPLRAYYATKPERIGEIRVLPAKPPHTVQVSFDLHHNNDKTTHTFFYDRTGKTRTGPYPTWEPGLLDATS